MEMLNAGRATTDQDSIVSEIYIAAPPERVFQALVDPAQILQWWGQAGVYVCQEYESDLRVGGRWRSAGTGLGGGGFKAGGEYLEIQPPSLLVYSWVASWTGAFQTTIRWELEPKDQGTLLRIRHSGFAGQPEIAQSYRGWPRMLGWLEAFVARGETVATRPPAFP